MTHECSSIATKRLKYGYKKLQYRIAWTGSCTTAKDAVIKEHPGKKTWRERKCSAIGRFNARGVVKARDLLGGKSGLLLTGTWWESAGITEESNVESDIHQCPSEIIYLDVSITCVRWDGALVVPLYDLELYITSNYLGGRINKFILVLFCVSLTK